MKLYFALLLAAVAGALQAEQITITNPVAGAQVPVGSLCTIAWTSQGLENRQLKIEVAIPGVANGQSVAKLVPVEAGQFQWRIPWGCPTGSTCKVQIALQDEGVWLWTSGAFALTPNLAPTVIVRSPAGGEQWPLGATRTVSWEPHNLAGALTLELLQAGTVVDAVSGIPVASNRFPYAFPSGLAAGSNYTLRLTSAAAPSATATSAPFGVTVQAPPPRKWTMLFYFDAVNKFTDSQAFQSIVDLGLMPASSNINYVCQFARSPRYAETEPWWGVKRFAVWPGLAPLATNAVQELGNVSMSDPNSLTDFINWAAENYPAEQYFLILSDHGDGWHNGLLEDELNGYHWMSTRQLQQALDAADTRLTMLGLDMCVEGEIEVAYQLRNTGPQILIASQYMETRNWPYHVVFQQLQSQLGLMTLEGLAANFCQAFVASHSDPLDNGTLAVIRLNQINALTAALAGFADTMTTNYTDQAAVRQQAGMVSAAFNDTIFYCARTKALQRLVYGLNINFPKDASATDYVDYTPAFVDFATDSHWKPFLTAYYQDMTNTWIGEARSSLGSLDGPIDIYRFCQAIHPATNTVRLTMVTVGYGTLVPVCNGSMTATNGEVLSIDGVGMQDPVTFATNYFVRWVGDANAIIADPSVQATTVRLTGDALVIGYFATNKNSYLVNFITEGNGSIEGTNSLTQVVPAGGDCSPVTATPEPGYAFAGWGGDYPATGNPLTITNVNMDTTVFAFFWPAPPIISCHRAGASVELGWPANAAGYVLESAGNLLSGPWNLVAGVTNNAVTLPLGSTNQFFRLRQNSDSHQ
jgi:hypothetical protein